DMLVGSPAGCATGQWGEGGVTGKPANHIPTAQDCSVCHKSTTAFGPNTPMNHTGIASGCTSCHNGQAFAGVTPVSKPSNHVPTTDRKSVVQGSCVSLAGRPVSEADIT